MKAILRSINNFSCKLKQSNNLKYNISPKIRSNKFKSISGNGNVTIEDAIKRNLKDYKIYGNTYQNSTTGKNLLNYIDTFVSSGSGLTSVINDDGSITTTGVPTSNYRPILNQYNIIDILEDGQTYTISSETQNKYIYVQINADKIAGGTDYIYNNNSRTVTFTVDKSVYRTYNIKIQTSTTSTWGSENRTITNKYQLEKGNLATEFEPYTNGPSPNPDYPQEIISCGDRTKNLFDKDSVDITPNEYLTQTGTTARDLAWLITPYIEVKSGENYVYQGITRAGNAPYSCYYDSSKALVSSFKQATGTNTITIPNGVSYVRFSIMNNNTYPDAQTFMIEKGSTATSYEPYGYKIPINVRSENLYDKNKNTQNYYLDINGNNESNTSWDITDYIPVIPNNNYTYKGITNTGIAPYCAYYDKNKNFVSTFKSQMFTNNIVIPNNIYYIRFSLCKTSANYNIGTFEIISNETTNIYLDEPLRKIEDYSDYIDFINFKIVRKIKEVILTGSETWALSTNFWSSSISDYAFLNNIPYSNKFKGYNNIASVTSFPNNTDNVIAFKNRKGELRIYIKATQFTTLANFKTWLSSNPVTVDYVLETPTEEDIELPNIKLIEGKNIITIGTDVQGVFETEYYSKEIIDISNYKYNLRKVED